MHTVRRNAEFEYCSTNKCCAYVNL